MRRIAFIAGLVMLAFTAGFGQGYVTHGIPPSVTSVTSSRSTGGIVPSVTSVTPATAGNWWNGATGTTTPSGNWWTGAVPQQSTNGRHRHHHNTGRSAVAYYPYYYPYYYDDSADAGYAQQPQQAAAEEPQAPAQTVFENRPGYKAPPVPNDRAADYSKPAPADSQDQQASDNPSEPQPTTVLVFRDGHQLEIGNYVIVGNTLYNMSGAYRQYKIQLADLDLDATIKANEDRGVEFKIPSTKKPA